MYIMLPLDNSFKNLSNYIFIIFELMYMLAKSHHNHTWLELIKPFTIFEAHGQMPHSCRLLKCRTSRTQSCEHIAQIACARLRLWTSTHEVRDRFQRPIRSVPQCYRPQIALTPVGLRQLLYIHRVIDLTAGRNFLAHR